MIGLAALAFASCAKHDFETMTQEQIVKAEYDAKFVAQFGQPASNHTWGFATTRALTRGVYADGNNWAGTDGGRLKVPPRLTTDQINAVVEYFQTVKNPDYMDPQWTDYFIQQVYKGGSSPKEGINPTYNEPYSPEKYTSAAPDADPIVGSDVMNHLAAVDPDQTPEFVDHNNNFNRGDCGEYDNVLEYDKDNPHSVNDTQYQYSDKINLMTESTTKKFGYYNSNSSLRHIEYTGLVDAETIITALGEAKAGCLRDGWNRRFMGFDFEMMVGPELFQDRYVKLSDIPGNAPQYIWDGDNVIKWYDVTYDENWQPTYTFAEGYDEYIRIDGQLIPYLTTNKNEYAGTLLANNTEGLTNINQTNLKVYKDYSDDVKNVECLNLPLLRAAFEAKYYPTEDKAQTWVKVGGTADGYYSDWIVTLTKAEQYDIPDEPDEPVVYEGRIMAEDLTVATNSDWDFNDVVFDWTIKDGKAYINLLAAGGTLPIRVGGHRNDNTSEPEGSIEIHSAAALGGYMVNTGVNTGKTSAAFVLDDHTYADHDGNGILITVQKGGDWVEIAAEQGEPAGKFNAPINTKWCEEYANIKKVYTSFAAWVANSKVEWAVNPTDKYVDYRDVNENRLEATAE